MFLKFFNLKNICNTKILNLPRYGRYAKKKDSTADFVERIDLI